MARHPWPPGIDSQPDDKVVKIKRELNHRSRVSQVQDWQKYLADKMWSVPWAGQATTYSVTLPWVGNAGVYRDWVANWPTPLTVYPQPWYDQSKRKA